MTEPRIKKRWIALAIALFAFSGQIPSCIMTSAPKFGRIVEATSGKGMPDVTVIAVGHFFAQGIVHGSGGMYTYRILTKTNSRGEYWIPNTWLHMQFAIPGTESKQKWVITAFKPDYAIAGDERSWSELDSHGWPVNVPNSIWGTPPAWWLGLIVWVEPIKMHAVEISPPDAAGYYGHIVSLGEDYSTLFSPAEVALRREGSQYFLPKVCAIDPDTNLDWGSGMGTFSYDRFKFHQEIDRTEPGWETRSPKYPQIPIFRASTICNALNQSWRAR